MNNNNTFKELYSSVSTLLLNPTQRHKAYKLLMPALKRDFQHLPFYLNIEEINFGEGRWHTYCIMDLRIL